MICIPFEPYDKVRISVPWVGVVMGWGVLILPPDGVPLPPNNLFMVGRWEGTAKKGGHIVINPAINSMHPVSRSDGCPMCMVQDCPGTVLRWGQRNRATGRTMNEGYGIVTTPFTFKQVDRLMAWKWYATTRSP